jgi:hypothetical protein
MGRDKILGLSLAILLIGFAGAFCFRNDQLVETGVKLARAKILDEQIAMRPGPKPYAADLRSDRENKTPPAVTLQGIESIDPFAELQTAQSNNTIVIRPNTAAVPSRSRSRLNPAPRDHLASSRKSAKRAVKAESDDPLASLIVRLSDPQAEITNIESSNEPAIIARPISIQTEKVNAVKRPHDEGTAERLILHRIQRGDTLTRLARRYLGDGNRYVEIYEANRDRLKSPGDVLRIGVSLRIPTKTSKNLQPNEGDSYQRKSVIYRSGNGTTSTSRSRQSAFRNVSRTRDRSIGPSGDGSLLIEPLSTMPSSDEESSTRPRDRFSPGRKSHEFQQGSWSRAAGRSLSQTAPENSPADNRQQDNLRPENASKKSSGNAGSNSEKSDGENLKRQDSNTENSTQDNFNKEKLNKENSDKENSNRDSSSREAPSQNDSPDMSMYFPKGDLGAVMPGPLMSRRMMPGGRMAAVASATPRGLTHSLREIFEQNDRPEATMARLAESYEGTQIR